MNNKFRLFVSAAKKSQDPVEVKKTKAPPGPTPLVIPEKFKGVTFDDMMSILYTAEKESGIPARLLSVMAFLESSGDPTTVAEDGDAKGLLQLTTQFMKQMKVKDIADIREVARSAARYLKHSYDVLSNSYNVKEFSGFGWDPDWELAVMAYHSGNQGVMNWLGSEAPMTGEHSSVGKKTLNYAERIAAYMTGGFDPEVMRSKWDKQAR